MRVVALIVICACGNEKTPAPIKDAGVDETIVDVQQEQVESSYIETSNSMGGYPNDNPSCGCPPGQKPKPR